ncbi:MAG TPA: type III glutamate--ammonia ligase [Abditibacterium sp.]|jgi:glutamine synthetase
MHDTHKTQQLFEQKGIQFFLMSFCDINGVPRAKLVPASCLADVAEGAAGFAGFAVDGLGQGPHDPDLSCVPQADSTVFPLAWKPGLAWVSGNMQLEGENFEHCPRSILSKNLEKAREMGFNLKMGVEPEFFLLDKPQKGAAPQISDAGDTLQKPCYGQLALLRNADFLMTIINYLNDLGFGVYQNDHEDANGQFEINWKFGEAMKVADQLMFFKFMVKALAEERGLHATFMPKPFENLTGNGAHMHLSLWDAETGKENLFLDKNDERGLSGLAYAFMGGVMAHARALCALTAPSVNSYKRFGAHSPRSGATWAPVFVSHAGNNRTAMIRVPAPGRIEYRTADGSANPYLAATGILAAGLDGIARNLGAGESFGGENLFLKSPSQAQNEGIELLPANLGEALNALENDSVLCAALGENYAKNYLATKRVEWDEYHEMTCKKVTDWEWNRYLAL